jgi:hypothetical protein
MAAAEASDVSYESTLNPKPGNGPAIRLTSGD